MRKVPVIFAQENNTEVCKKKLMTLNQLFKENPKYQVYMIGTIFAIPHDYNKVNANEKKPEDFTERIGVSQIVSMYKDLKRSLENEK